MYGVCTKWRIPQKRYFVFLVKFFFKSSYLEVFKQLETEIVFIFVSCLYRSDCLSHKFLFSY
jgi:hypothetical protein